MSCIDLDARTINYPPNFVWAGGADDAFLVITFTQELIEILLACDDGLS